MNKFRELADKKLLKFLLVGGINTFIGTGIMFGLYHFAHWSYWASSASNYILTSILSFVLNKHFTFQNKEQGFHQVFRFILNIAICYVLAYGIAKPVCLRFLASVDAIHRDQIAMLTGMCLFTIFNYLGQRLFTFREK